MNHLCCVYDSKTMKVICFYELEADDFYYARHRAQKLFEDSIQYQMYSNIEWKVDSVAI